MGGTKSRARRRNLRSGTHEGAAQGPERAGRAPRPATPPAEGSESAGEGDGAEMMAVAALAQLGVEAAARCTKLRRKVVKDCWSSLRLLCGI
jgi:hypothetical protein